MHFKLPSSGGQEMAMRIQFFLAEHAMRITFTLALLAAACSVLVACHPSVVAESAVHSPNDSGQSVQSTAAQALPTPERTMEPILAFDEKWVTPQ
jgi:hypothetical protein